MLSTGTTTRADHFLSVAHAYLSGQRWQANPLATLAQALAEGEGSHDPLFVWAADPGTTGQVVAAAVHPRSFVTVGPAAPPAARVLAERLHDSGRPVAGVAGDARAAAEVAARIAALRSVPAELAVRETVQVLGELRPPSGVPGAARAGGGADRERYLDWQQAFHLEAFAGRPAPSRAVLAAAVLGRLRRGLVLFWRDGAGEPVSMAAMHPAAFGVARIGPVFTPPEHRGRGYGAAVTAAAARLLLAGGAPEVMLMTDRANPVANRVYARLGFRPVGEAAEWVVGPT